MNNSLLIGKLIYQVIEDDSSITALVGDRVYPLVAPYDVAFPYIVYSRVNDYSSTISKDGIYGDTVTFQVNVFSDKYIDSAEIANLVRNTFERHQISNGELTIEDIQMSSASESFIEDTYSQTLTFDCQTN